MNQNVLINAVEYKGVSVFRMGLESNVTQHPVEEVEIAEHIALRAPVFRLDLTLYDEWEGTGESAELIDTRDDKFKRLQGLWLTKTPFTFECDFGVFEDVVITSFDSEETGTSKTTYPVTLVLRQILTVELIPIDLQVITDADGNIIGVVPTGSTLTEVTLTRPEAIAEGENKSILESLWEWIAG